MPDHTDTSKLKCPYGSITIAGVFNLFLVSVRENFNKLAKTRKLGIFRKNTLWRNTVWKNTLWKNTPWENTPWENILWENTHTL